MEGYRDISVNATKKIADNQFEPINRMIYGAEYECNEPYLEDVEQLSQKQYRHIWCHRKNGEELASTPAMMSITKRGEELGSHGSLKKYGPPYNVTLPGTIPSLLKVSADKYADKTCMVTRPILSETQDGKKRFWKKGNAKARSYRDVFIDVTNASKGLLLLDGVLDSLRAIKTSVPKVEQVESVFMQIDINSDGGITPIEIMNAIKKSPELGEQLGLRGDGNEMAFQTGRLFQKMDADSDHKINLDEFKAHIGHLFDDSQEDSVFVVALLGDTSCEWQISGQAALLAGMTITTVYSTLGHEAMLHGLQQTEAEVICMDFELYDSLKMPVLSKCPNLKHIVLIGETLTAKSGAKRSFPKVGTADEFNIPVGSSTTAEGGLIVERMINVTTFKELKNAGAGDSSLDLDKFAPSQDDLALIMYTSGSTGLPKGVKLTHINFVSVLAAVEAQGAILPSPEDNFIAFLPLAHILELIVETALIMKGATIMYGHVRTLTATSPYVKTGDMNTADLTYYQPTLMAAVPAVLDTIKGGLIQKVEGEGGPKAKLFFGAVFRALRKMDPGGDHSFHKERSGLGGLSFLDSVILGKVRGLAGLGNCRVMISGGAPLAASTQLFCQAVFCPIAQGYGATETTGIMTAQECTGDTGRPHDTGAGRVGSIFPSIEIKLLDVPSMSYMTSDEPARGEILVSGRNVASGYYKLPEQTAEDFRPHSDGKTWFHTGDIGVMHPDGVLQIVDRKKDLVKLAGGEYVSLGKVEANLKGVQGIDQCCVFAQPSQRHCVVIVSQPEKGWEASGGKPTEEALLVAVQKEMGKLVRLSTMAKFEVPARLAIVDDVWRPDGEPALITAAMKVKRNEIREFYNGDGGALAQMQYRFIRD
jgi:long-chain acyl-CoA synthetase